MSAERSSTQLEAMRRAVHRGLVWTVFGGLVVVFGQVAVSRAEGPDAVYNVVEGTIEYPAGNRIGNVVGNIAVDLKGKPFSQSEIGIDTLRRGDGTRYFVGKDGTLSQIDPSKTNDQRGSSLDVSSSKVSKANPGSVLLLDVKDPTATADNPNNFANSGAGNANVGAPNTTPPARETKLNNQIPWDNVPSQLPEGAGSPNAELPRAASDLHKTGQNDNEYTSYIDMLDDWSSLYGGVTKSPTVIDAREKALEYPNLIATDKDGPRPKLGSAFGVDQEMSKPRQVNDLGIDDEVLKTSMAVYQPLFRMRKDFLENEFERDNYLNSALTLRGIAIMTMGFLDKTVGAGLTAVQQQADQDTIQQLLKQINWSESKLANPERAQVYRDTDEKLEACLEMAVSKGKAPEEVQKGKSTRKYVEYKQCSQRCGPAPQQNEYRAKQVTADSQKKTGNGSYAYCVCCAETDKQLNWIASNGKNTKTSYLPQGGGGPGQNGTGGDAKNGADDREWSLVERTLYGAKQPQGGGKAEGAKVQKLAFYFKEMYGDVLLRTTPSNETGEDFLQYVYLFPKWSVQRKIAALRDGCLDNGKKEGNENVGESGDCPMRELSMKYGICPSVTGIIRNWAKIKKGDKQDAETASWFTEASMGYPISGAVVESFFSINGNPAADIQQIKGRLKRVIDNYCDSSAVAAFTRYHSRLSAIIHDHIAMNQQVTAGDKARVLSLLNRVSEQLTAAQVDIASAYPTEAIYTGSLQAKDRKAAGYTAAVAESTQDTQRRASYSGGLTSFGGPTYLATGNNGGSTGGTGAPPRTAPSFSDAITQALQKVE